MSQLNPYDGFLDGRSPEAILAATPEAIRGLLGRIGEAHASTRPAPGKWSAGEIVSHLADCEMVFGFRLRQTLAEQCPTIQPFDQDRWASEYSGIRAGDAFAAFQAMRAWNLERLRSALPAAAARRLVHPERGEMTFQILVETLAGHDLNHLAQLEKIAAPAR